MCALHEGHVPRHHDPLCETEPSASHHRVTLDPAQLAGRPSRRLCGAKALPAWGRDGSATGGRHHLLLRSGLTTHRPLPSNTGHPWQTVPRHWPLPWTLDAPRVVARPKIDGGPSCRPTRRWAPPGADASSRPVARAAVEVRSVRRGLRRTGSGGEHGTLWRACRQHGGLHGRGPAASAEDRRGAEGPARRLAQAQ